MNKKSHGLSTSLKKKVLIRFSLVPFLLGVILFLPAGSFRFWPAWIFCGILLVPMAFVVVYFLKNDPEVLRRRLEFQEKEKEQKLIVKLGNTFFILGALIPGLDYRFGWSAVPVWLVLLSDAIALIGYLIFFWVLRENSYASRIVVVEEGQKVITTGPYSLVRHPMYSGIILLYLFSPLALASYWALIPISSIVPILVFRIFSEEKILKRDLPGYVEYCEKVKYRLIPRVW